MVRYIVHKYSEHILFEHSDEFSREELITGLEIILTSLMNVIAFILLFSLFGFFKCGIVFLVTFCWFRGFTGGIHMKTQFRCFCLMTTFAAMSIWVTLLMTTSVQFVISLLITIVMFRFGNKNKYPIYCLMVLVAIGCWTIIDGQMSTVSAMGLLFAWITKLWEVKLNEINDVKGYNQVSQ